ncbi:L-rhamnose-1-dehydrogenase [Grifola frondosa]|uniref:L-rhamnose-1-dehydrogenase n=1 Tax=Grifola frondosa TaxID=5627 RepID=A0A1C7MQJ7_GRIFR|nr:L-rhamnose-1-dehydrogenase [Grifola frondosa]
MGLLSNKVICITGASRGIGRACAIESAHQGATGLILHYLGDAETEAEIHTLKQDIENQHPSAKVVVVPGDIGDRATSAKIVEVG